MELQTFTFGPFQYDRTRGTLTNGGAPVQIGHKANLLLGALIGAQGDPVSKDDLLNAAWPDIEVEENNLSVQIAALRKLLGDDQTGNPWIVTVPRLGYRFSMPGGEGSSEAVPAKSAIDEADNGQSASIAVLPFANLSGDVEQEYLADGIAEDIITTLTRCRWIFVASRNSGFTYKGKSVETRQIAEELGVRYVLEGSVRRSADTVRVSAQLVDARAGNDIWAERYDLKAGDFFAIQDEIALRVAAAIEPELLKSESALAVRQSGSMTAMNLVWKGTWHFHRVTPEGHRNALELFREAREIDPDLAEAHSWTGRVCAGLVAYGWIDNPDEIIREGVESSLRAVELDRDNPYPHYALAVSQIYAKQPLDAVSAAEHALEINPSFALGYLILGHALVSSGQAEPAIGNFIKGLELNANDPQNFVWHYLLSAAYFFSGNYQHAIKSARAGAKIRPRWRPFFETMAMCFAKLGDEDGLVRTVEQANSLEGSSASALAPLLHTTPQWAETMNQLLTEVGIER